MYFNDPNFGSQQWYLGPNGINILGVYDQYNGAGIRIGLVDTGIDTSLADLKPNLGAGGWNALTHTADYTNIGGDQHGTWVAQLLAAAANNGIDTIGTAWGATLVGFKMQTRDLRTPAQELELLQRQNTVDISHNSWSYSGQSFTDNFLGAYAQQGAAIADAATTGRAGLGTVIVRSAGNDGTSGEDMNTHNYQNNRFTMAVGATDASGNVQDFSNHGAALWVVTPATATSFAAPLVSGTVALMLQANPSLGYRDVQAIIALSARFTDANEAWSPNHAAGFMNGGGFRSSNATGFGMLDAHGAVRLAETWTAAPKTEANILHYAATGTAFAVGDVATASNKVTIAQDLLVERVDLKIDLLHPHLGDLKLSLVSPTGTESVLLDHLGKGSYGGSGELVFTLDSSQFFWESGKGDWTLKVQDTVSGSSATVKSWSLDLYGGPQTADDTYYLTDRYEGLAQSEPNRTTLADADGGSNTLNAAAVSTGMVLDLHPGVAGTVIGQPFRIAAGTLITTAFGGDGNDRITATDAATTLHGGRGNDTLVGGAGNDLLEGGVGNDLLQGNGGINTAVFYGVQARFAWAVQADGSLKVTDTAGQFGTDTLYGIQKLAFADGTIDAPAGGTGGPPVPPPPSATLDIGSGADAVVLKISQDAWQGSAQYKVLLDGVQVGGVLTAVALHGQAMDTVTLHGDFASGGHSVAVQFLNDAWGNTATTDRNLYFEAASYHGAALAVSDTTLFSTGDTGAAGFSIAGGTTPPPAGGAVLDIGSGPDSVLLKISQDAYLGNAQYKVLLDGVQVGGTLTASALHGQGSDSVTLHGSFGAGAHSVSVVFLNDAWGGTAATDRNLYFEAASYNGAALAPSLVNLETTNALGRVTFNAAGTSPPPAGAAIDIGSGADSLVLKISQDAYQGAAQYKVMLDGVQVGGVLSATALHGQGNDTVTLHGDFAAGNHRVSVQFLNDLWGGTAATDRNLYVDAASYHGGALLPDDSSLMSTGDTAHIAFQAAAGATLMA